MLKIYTRSGDAGKTSLYDQTRVDKDDIRVESYGTIDELNAALGVAKRYIGDAHIFGLIERIQRELFDVAGELATTEGESFPERITEAHVEYLEGVIDAYVDKMGRDQPFRFILPGSSDASAYLHVARTVCRRAERRMISLAHEAPVSPVLMKYVNRLADCIYAVARFLEEHPAYVEFKSES